MNLLTTEDWRQFTAEHPETHILQTLEWARLKAAFGWSPKFIRHGQTGALILFKRLPLGLSVAYIPRGPIGKSNWPEFWNEVDSLCRREHAVFLRVEPDIWQPVEEEALNHIFPGFKKTNQTIQPPRTIMVNLEGSEDDLLMRMKSKTRYNIRLAARKGVKIISSTAIDTFHQMMLTTGDRDKFGIHACEYYQKAYDLFAPNDKCALLIANYQGLPLAGLMVFAHRDTAWYLFGASTNQKRNLMPTYLLQWEAMRWARDRGCKVYDLWGIPDHPESVLEDSFLEKSEGLWGVYRFKRGFGGEIRRTIGAWDRVYHPLLYNFYKIYVSRHQAPSA